MFFILRLCRHSFQHRATERLYPPMNPNTSSAAGTSIRRPWYRPPLPRRSSSAPLSAASSATSGLIGVTRLFPARHLSTSSKSIIAPLVFSTPVVGDRGAGALKKSRPHGRESAHPFPEIAHRVRAFHRPGCRQFHQARHRRHPRHQQHRYRRTIGQRSKTLIETIAPRVSRALSKPWCAADA